MSDWKPIRIVFEFNPGMLLMRREYVGNFLRESVMKAFDEAQSIKLKNDGNPSVTVSVEVPPEEGLNRS
jgi:hypothetical protein